MKLKNLNDLKQKYCFERCNKDYIGDCEICVCVPVVEDVKSLIQDKIDEMLSNTNKTIPQALIDLDRIKTLKSLLGQDDLNDFGQKHKKLLTYEEVFGENYKGDD